MFYRKIGNGPALVLLHGFPDSGEIWAAMTAALSAHFTLVIPDLPGSGNSKLEKQTTLAEMAIALKLILDKEGIEKTLLAGHSMGGYTALAFAKLYPQSVVGLSLIHSTATADDNEKKINRQKAIDLIRNGGKETFVKQMTLHLFAPTFKNNNPQAIKDKVTAGLKMSEDGMVNFYQAMMVRDDNMDVVRNAPFPLQWIIGEEDLIINYKKNLKECHQCSINFVTLYSDCGHISMIEHHSALIADLTMFGNYCNNI